LNAFILCGKLFLRVLTMENNSERYVRPLETEAQWDRVIRDAAGAVVACGTAGMEYGLKLGAILGGICGLPFMLVGAIPGAVIGAAVGLFYGLFAGILLGAMPTRFGAPLAGALPALILLTLVTAQSNGELSCLWLLVPALVGAIAGCFVWKKLLPHGPASSPLAVLANRLKFRYDLWSIPLGVRLGVGLWTLLCLLLPVFAGVRAIMLQ
jgi:hypothetical protein